MSGSLFDKLCTLIKDILGNVSEESPLEILDQRVTPPTLWDTEWLDEPVFRDEFYGETLEAIKDSRCLHGL